METRFDPEKDVANQVKHGLSPAFGFAILEDADCVMLASFRPIDGEDRFKVVGLVGAKLYTGIYVWRDGGPRFISVRRSNQGEQRSYRTPSRS